jgi:cyclase
MSHIFRIRTLCLNCHFYFKKVIDFINVPLIIAGGAGNESHLLEGLKLEKVNAVATANLFNFIGDGLINARKNILKENINIANW